MAGGCSIRALWILNPTDSVVFSRRSPVGEKRWRSACVRESSASNGGGLGYTVRPLLPTDGELVSALAEKKAREGSVQGFGVRVLLSLQRSDSWLDDPITRHIISLCFNSEGEAESFMLWPLVLHVKGSYIILV